MNSNFDKQVADIALRRGLSRASVLCALLKASGQARTSKIAPAKHGQCLRALASIPQDISRSAAFKQLCRCPYGAQVEDEAERHKNKCLYVLWRDLIGEPLESVLAEVEP